MVNLEYEVSHEKEPFEFIKELLIWFKKGSFSTSATFTLFPSFESEFSTYVSATYSKYLIPGRYQPYFLSKMKNI